MADHSTMGASSDADDLFTFRVGPKKQIFQVDKRMVAQASPVFDRMMNNGMKETQDGAADLPEVEPATFLTFLNFAYHAAEAQQYSVAYSLPISSTSAIVGPLIVVLIDAGHKTFECRRCDDNLEELRFTKTFPFCTQCSGKQPSITGYHVQCVVCEKKRVWTEASGMLCQKCVNKLGLDPNKDAAELLLPGVQHMQGDIDFFRFDVPILAREAASEMRRNTRMTCSTQPTEIKKIFDFADAYGVINLRKLAMLEFFETLAMGGGSAESLAHLIIHIYNTTPSSGFGAKFAFKHVLRRMLSAYVAYHKSALEKSPEIAHVLSYGGDFGVDFFMATSMIAQGKLSKGWKSESESVENQMTPNESLMETE